MGRAEVAQNGESSSGSRLTRTRLQGGPTWTLQDTLILVNEIVAVEKDCQDALSSYQKWAIIAENCTAFEVVRNANQCRRKWESLLADFNFVKEWESCSGGIAYSSLECEKKQEIGLPVEFDTDMYKAIDDFTRETEQANSNSESDSEAEADVDVPDVVTSGSKPKRVISRATPQKNKPIQRKQPEFKEEDEKPARIVKEMDEIANTKLEDAKTGSKPKRVISRTTPQKNKTIERKQHEFNEEDEKPERIVKEMDEIAAIKIEDTKTGSKRKRAINWSTPQKSKTIGRKKLASKEKDEKPVKNGPKPKKIKLESSIEKSTTTGRKQLSSETDNKNIKNIPVSSEEQLPSEKNNKNTSVSSEEQVSSEKNIPVSLEEEQEKHVTLLENTEQILARRVQENAELIHTILNGVNINTNIVDEDKSDLKEDEAVKTEMVKCKADKLLTCLTDLVNNLEQLCDVVS